MPAFDGGVEIDPARPRLPAELRVRFDVVCRLGAPDGVPQTFPLAQVDDTVSCEAVDPKPRLGGLHPRASSQPSAIHSEALAATWRGVFLVHFELWESSSISMGWTPRVESVRRSKWTQLGITSTPGFRRFKTLA